MQSNSYARGLGLLSVALMCAGVLISILSSSSEMLSTQPVFMAGVGAGILWFAVKAIVVQISRTAVYSELRERDRV